MRPPRRSVRENRNGARRAGGRTDPRGSNRSAPCAPTRLPRPDRPPPPGPPPKPSRERARVPPRAARAVLVSPADLAVAEAADDVIVDHPGRLHVRVADARSHEAEAAPAQILAHRARFRRFGRDLLEVFPEVALRPSVHEAPDVAVERAELLLHLEEGAGVADG